MTLSSSRIQQIASQLASLEAELGQARAELSSLLTERRRAGTSITLFLGANGGFSIDLGGETKVQHVRVPCSQKGAEVMLRILRDRERTWDRALGSDARPVQSQVNKWLHEALQATAEEKAEAESGRAKGKLNGVKLPEISLEDLGI